MDRRIVLVCALFAAILPASAQTWELVWSDEFDYVGPPDTGKWDYDLGGGGWGNQEVQYYTDRTENVRVDGDALVIEARAESFGGSSYTSARLVTRGRAAWRYGRFEIRAQLPSGVGTWPAIWMLPEDWVYGGWPDSGEIDIMEHVGKDQGNVHSALHMGGRNSNLGTQPTTGLRLADASTAFHVYAVEWSPREIRFYVDDQLVQVSAPGLPTRDSYQDPGTGWELWPFDQDFHLLLNIAVGGTWGGPVIDAGAFPTQMLVDYVRVYEAGGTLPQVSLTPSATSLSPGQTLTLDAAAVDPDGQLESVTIRQGDVSLAAFTAPPFTVELPNVQEGCYEVSVEAVDTAGWSAASAPIAITVGSNCGQAPATISPQQIPGVVEMEAYDLGGNEVAYFELDQSNSGNFRDQEPVDIGTRFDTGGHYLGWLSGREWVEYTVEIDQGTYRLDAELKGAGTFELQIDGSEIVEVSFDVGTAWTTHSMPDIDLPGGVQVLRFRSRSTGYEIDRMTFVETGAVPTLTLDQPLDGAQVTPGTAVTLSATPADRDGDVASVQFFQGIAEIASVTAAPYAFTVDAVSEGCYQVAARAVDSRGNASDLAQASLSAGACVRAPYLMRPAALPGTLRAAHFDLGEAYRDLSSGDGTFREEPVDLAFDDTEGYYLTDVAAREWIGFTVDVAQAGTYDVSFRVRTTSGGTVQFEENGVDAGPRMDFAPTGGDWQNQTFSGIPLTGGVNDLRLVARSAGFELATISLIEPGATSVSPGPVGFELGEPFPNPTQGGAAVPVTLPAGGVVNVRVFDALGRQVTPLVATRLSAGEHSVPVPTSGLVPGIYLLRVEANGRQSTRIVTLLR